MLQQLWPGLGLARIGTVHIHQRIVVVRELRLEAARKRQGWKDRKVLLRW